MSTLAVFTGDIVKSTTLTASELDDIFAAIEACADLIGSWQTQRIPFQRFRGDGWQAAVPARYSFRSAMALRAAVRSVAKGLDTRIGIGLGEGATDDVVLARADGPAFISSGHALDTMRRSTRMSAPDGPIALQAALPLADQIVAGWTAKQAQIVLGLLPPERPTQAALAKHMNTNQQVIQRQADAAGTEAILETCLVLEMSMLQPN